MRLNNHIICITIDVDPDELSGISVNRNAIAWEGLDYILPRISRISEVVSQEIPITWFLRIDQQIGDYFGASTYLYDSYLSYWKRFLGNNDEIAWHPHLYEKVDGNYAIMQDPPKLEEALYSAWEDIRNKTDLQIRSFRNGEGWLSPAILKTINHMGIQTDSTALPGIYRTDCHPMNWKNTTNEIYYPDFEQPDKKGIQQLVVEFPMSTWQVQAPYDKQPRLRYMNPAIHQKLFREAVMRLEISDKNEATYWNFIFHPSEILPKADRDFLYANSLGELFENIKYFCVFLEQKGCIVKFSTISKAINIWKDARDKR